MTSKNLAFDYTLNTANQRTRVNSTDGSYWDYGYDSLGQITSAKKHWSDGTPASGQQFEYTFDDIGNRTLTAANGRTANYAANNLNQYTQRDVPGAFDVLGSAATNATVTVNDQSVTRHGESFSTTLSLTNNVGPVFQDVKVYGLVKNAGPNGEDVFDDRSGTAFLPKTPEPFKFDLDGNLVQNGRWVFTWNAENKLIAAESISSVPAAAKKKVEFTRDDRGRIIERKVYDWNGSSYVLVDMRRFVYDGTHCLAELDGANAVVKCYLWGNDLSGSYNGAGGVGGLLAVTDVLQGAHFVAMDGNGNVAALVNAADGKVSAEYEYEAFGKLVRSTGVMADVNPYRFSTKPTDPVTKLLMYEERPYDSETGRWQSRDPIEEGGGLNLYGFVKNDSVNGVDPFGLWHGGDHDWMTRGAWKSAVKPLDMETYISRGMEDMLVQQNAYVDNVLLGNNYWHFNRSSGEDIGSAIASYASTIRNNKADIREWLSKPGVDSCRNALKTMGRLSHAYQDYYAHAIRKDSNGSAKTMGSVTGSPISPGSDMKPSSWDELWMPGEHGWSEPGDRAPDADSRKFQARGYTEGEFQPFLKDWWKACKCHAKDIFNH